MTDELIATIRDTPEVLPYIDIPVQHCCERVLSAMNRSGSEEELEALFARLCREIPDMVIRTTYLTAFPGETEDEVDAMLDFMDRVGFDYTSVFPYSPEEGTRACEMPDQIDETTKVERTQRAIDLAESLGFAATASHVGTSRWLSSMVSKSERMAPSLSDTHRSKPRLRWRCPFGYHRCHCWRCFERSFCR